MADAVAELEGTLYQQLPALLNELAANHQNVAHIADWCGQTYVTPGEDKAATFERTQSYLKDALLTVAGHMTSAGASLTQTIDLQAVELESLDAMVRQVPCATNYYFRRFIQRGPAVGAPYLEAANYGRLRELHPLTT